MQKKKNRNVQIRQVPRDRRDADNNIRVGLKNTFNLVIQLLPVWFMILLQAITNIKFEMEDYTSNLLVFTIMTSVTNIAGLGGKESLDILADVIKYTLSIILCFSLFFYVLILFKKSPGLEIKDMPILFVAIGLCIIVFVAMFYQEIRKVNEKECG